MLGIAQISSFIPQTKLCNYDCMDKFGVDEVFIKDKIGFTHLSRKQKHEKASDLCVKAYEKLENLDKNEVQCVVLVTQNGDFKIPHTSAILHKKLDLPQNCACFDINLACSGYIYALGVILSFMRDFGFEKGLLFTCDPYSEVITQVIKTQPCFLGTQPLPHLSHQSHFMSPKPLNSARTAGALKRYFARKIGFLWMGGRCLALLCRA